METLRKYPLLRWLVVLFCLGYMVFPTFGVFELIPDNLPFVGNLDEFAVMFVMLAAADILPWVNSPSRLRLLMLGVIGVVSFLYILNPTAGILEFIPDNFPIIGNLDDAIAAFGASAVIAQGMYPRWEAEKAKRELPPTISQR